MSTNKFPSPSINRLIDEDPMIVKVPIIDPMEAMSRSSALPKNIRNSMTINHVGKDQGPGRIESDVKGRGER